MIIGADRGTVIENIKRNAESGNFYAKVETGDPVLTPEEEREIVDRYLRTRGTLPYKFKRFFARIITSIATSAVNRDTEIAGELDAAEICGGVIVTSNHFSPMENTVVRHCLKKSGIGRMSIVSQVSNFAMSGIIGFLMNYADTIPISGSPKYLAGDLARILREKLDGGEAVLIYPEQEMWFNYRKPRPPKEGAYHFAARLSRPVLSLFVEIKDKDERDTDEFYKVRYRVHVLGLIYPDPEKSVRENREEMCRRDYELKREAYERIYGRSLSYEFENRDIAGWIYEGRE